MNNLPTILYGLIIVIACVVLAVVIYKLLTVSVI